MAAAAPPPALASPATAPQPPPPAAAAASPSLAPLGTATLPLGIASSGPLPMGIASSGPLPGSLIKAAPASAVAATLPLAPPPGQLPPASCLPASCLPASSLRPVRQWRPQPVGIPNPRPACGSTNSSSLIARRSLPPSPPLPPLPVRGLRNLGNSCYLNSVLQNVVATRGLREHFMLKAPPPESQEGDLTLSLRKFLRELHVKPPERPAPASGGAAGKGGGGKGGAGGGGKGGAGQQGAIISSGPDEAIRPVDLLQAVSRKHGRYSNKAEQDSHEVLRQLLEGIRSEEVSRINAEREAREARERQARVQARVQAGLPPEGGAGAAADGSSSGVTSRPVLEDPPTVVDDLFSGELRSTIVCLSCGAVSCSYEPFLDLSLSIPKPTGAPGGGSGGVGAASNGTPNANGHPPGGAGGSAAHGGGKHVGNGVGGSPLERIPEEQVLAKLAPEQRTAHDRLQLSACLQAFSAPESLDGEDAYHCEACAKRAKEAAERQAAERRASVEGASGHEAANPPAKPIAPASKGQPALKWLQVSRKPNALTLHLKRFRSSGKAVHKLDAHVPFPTTLDLAPFATSSTREQVTQLANAQLQPAAAEAPRATGCKVAVEHEGSFKRGALSPSLRAPTRAGTAWAIRPSARSTRRRPSERRHSRGGADQVSARSDVRRGPQARRRRTCGAG